MKKLCICYIIIKFLNLINVLFQMFLIKIFLHIDFYNLTVKPVAKFVYDLNPKFWLYKKMDVSFDKYDNSFFDSKSVYLANSPYFPLKSLCIFRIRELITINSYAVMCSLPINLFIQYIFVFLSIWYIVIFVLNIHFIIQWIFEFKPSAEMAFVKKKLLIGLKYDTAFFKQDKTCYGLYHFLRKKAKFSIKKEKDLCKCNIMFEKFVFEYLNSDFIFILRIISFNEKSDILVQHIFVYFWKLYINSE